MPRTVSRMLVLGLTVLGGLTAGLAGGVSTDGPAAAAPGEHCFVVRSHGVFVHRDPTDQEIAFWLAAFAGGTGRWQLPRTLANGDEWLRVEVTKLYQQALDRSPSESDIAYWTGQLRRGAKVTRVASLIFGSPEFATRNGTSDEPVIAAMYPRILRRSAGTSELAYWVGQAQTRTNGAIAADLTFSPESRTGRVTTLFEAVLGRRPDAGGLQFWVERLRTVNDVRLATDLASTPEFFSKAQQGCTEPPLTTQPPTTPPPTTQPPPATTQPPTGNIGATFTLRGHGWGHGRGMGQYGALGYAVDHGWATDRILAHYYGGTTAGTAADVTQRVYLVGSAGTDLTVTQPAKALQVSGFSGTWGAVSVRRLSATTFRVYASATASCAPTWSLLGDTTAGDVTVRSGVAQGDTADRMLTDCRSSRRYRGALHNVRTSGAGANAVVNEVGIEGLLRGILPGEVSPSWASAGGGKGAAAVRAQAVAARSYALAGDTRWGSWATTCDSTTCQVYKGFGVEDSRTNAAVAATAGQVRRTASGAVARTEFSSSTGGWSAGGAFPAVLDEGDDYAGNPNHSWSVTVSRSKVEAAYPGRGTFLRFASIVRTGNGDLGGRVVTVRLVFSGGAVDQTGEQVRNALVLKSAWFSLA